MVALPHSDRRPYSRILIVDDEDSLRKVLRLGLTQDGYDVREAESGQAALDLMARWAPDVIVSDLLMPGVDGIELLRQSKEADDTIGFIVLTGVGTTRQAVQALRLNADDYLLKPYDVDELAISVSRALERRALVKQNRFYQQCLELRVAQLGQQLERLTEEALVSLAGAVEARDGYTGAHLERVTRYAQAVGRRAAARHRQDQHSRQRAEQAVGAVGGGAAGDARAPAPGRGHPGAELLPVVGRARRAAPPRAVGR
jgi:DNA-binding response OmpR family regulator